MNDRELLKMAAKAGGVVSVGSGINGIAQRKNGACLVGWWNPLADDGDALRLAADLSLDVHINQNHVEIFSGDLDDCIDQLVFCGDVRSATRRAITRAAAEIGRAMR